MDQRHSEEWVSLHAVMIMDGSQVINQLISESVNHLK